MSRFGKRLPEILPCPAARIKLRYDAKTQKPAADEADSAYPIRNGVPIMLVGEARLGE